MSNSPDTQTIAPPASRGLGWLEPLVFVGGLCGIGIELATSRLIAPYFGSSTFIWANLIGLTLTYLAIGYYLGGRLADRRPDPRILYLLTTVAAVFAGLIPLMSRPILRISLDAFDNIDIGAFYGSLLGTLLLLAIPITLLGFVTPYAVKLRVSDLSRSGKTAGRLYALSTIGSILGSFLPVVLFIPIFGTAATFLIFSLLLASVSLLGLLSASRARSASMLLLLVVLMVAGNVSVWGAQIKPPYRGELIYETDSEYNYIQVLREGDRILLALNEGHAIHSIYDPNRLITGGPWDYFMLAPLFRDDFDPSRVSRAAMIGLAGGTGAREMLHVYPNLVIDGVEIDQVVVDVGREYFAMDDPRLNVIVADGRYFLHTTDHRYDIVAIDAYRQPYIPFQLTTREFFTEVRDRLLPGGSVVVNVGRTESDFRLVDAIGSTIASVFPYVFAVDVAAYNNTMIFGFADQASLEAFARNAATAPPGLLADVCVMAVGTGSPRIAPSHGTVFTDDHAPVELVIDQIIFGAATE